MRSAEIQTTILDVVRWAQEVTHLHARIAPRFARPEPRRRALAYLQGLLSETERKNSWQLAEHAREATPDGMQRLLASAVWDDDLVRDDLRAYVVETIGTPGGILVIDETSFPKRGKNPQGCKGSIAERPGNGKTVKLACFSPTSPPVDIPCSIVHSTFPTREQVQQLAALHDRVLTPDETLHATSPVEPLPPEALQKSTLSDTRSIVGQEKTIDELDAHSLARKLSHLEALIVNQQQQLILLIQELFRERATRTQPPLSPLDISAHLQEERGADDLHAENPTISTTVRQNGIRPLHPAEQRARLLVLPPLIEYSASGMYVVISSQV